jgi:hypothetical protein
MKAMFKSAELEIKKRPLKTHLFSGFSLVKA